MRLAQGGMGGAHGWQDSPYLDEDVLAQGSVDDNMCWERVLRTAGVTPTGSGRSRRRNMLLADQGGGFPPPLCAARPPA